MGNAMNQLVARLWNAGIAGKLLVGFVALLLSCCALGIVGNLLNPQAARQRAEQRQQTATAAAQGADVSAPTIPTNVAVAPTIAESIIAPTTVPSATSQSTAAPQPTISQMTATAPALPP